MRFKLILIFVIILVGYLTIIRSKMVIDLDLPQVINVSKPKPTPFEFEEMTLPYLRSRDYLSNLSNLDLYSENTLYSSYLTSYSSDGLNVNGLLTIPKTPKPQKGFPAIVFVHGYIAPTIYRTTERYVSYVDGLAKSGYVVFKIDLRGHGSSEGEAGGSYYSSDYIIDTLNAYSALQNSDFVDGDKIGLWGHSMAGNVTFRSFIAKQDIPAVAIWGGAGFTYEDLVNYRISDTSYRPPQQNTERQRKRQRLRELYGEFNKDHEFWKQVTPINYLGGVSGAVSLHHAVNDNVVSVEYSRNLNAILENTDIKHEFNEYTGGGHNIENPYFNQAMKDTLDFYDRYLKGN